MKKTLLGLMVAILLMPSAVNAQVVSREAVQAQIINLLIEQVKLLQEKIRLMEEINKVDVATTIDEEDADGGDSALDGAVDERDGLLQRKKSNYMSKHLKP